MPERSDWVFSMSSQSRLIKQGLCLCALFIGAVVVVQINAGAVWQGAPQGWTQVGATECGREVAITRHLKSNRVSAPDANSCASCHNAPYGIVGGGGDFVTGVFVLGQRFDFMTFDRADALPLRGAVDEAGMPASLQDAGDGYHGRRPAIQRRELDLESIVILLNVNHGSDVPTLRAFRRDGEGQHDAVEFL